MRGDFEKQKRRCLLSSCGKAYVPKSARQKYCCRECYKKAVGSNKGCSEDASLSTLKALIPSQRWEKMSWKELTAELASMHKSYGDVQQMYYNNTLPEDFGLGGVAHDRD